MPIGSGRGARIVLLILGALLCLPAWAQPAGVINGRVTDASGEFGFGDATVRIDALDRETSTDRSGRFRFTNVPTGEYRVQATYVGAEPGSVPVTVQADEAVRADIPMGGGGSAQLEGLLVEGQAAGQAAAISRRRRDETVVDVLSSDSVGQFPDQNVAEALQRAPGISVQRDQGEGRFAVIRGIDPQFNTTNIDGARIPGTEAGSRAVNLDVISSDLIESVEINKAVTPDMDGDAVGGNIEINTLTAFDVGGRSLRVTGGGSYNTQNEETSPELSLLYTDLFSLGGGEENLGIAVAVSKFDREFASDGIETSDGWFRTQTPGGDTVRVLEEGEQRDYSITRDRTSASVNFDYKPDDDRTFYLRTLYSEFEEEEFQVTNLYNFADGNIDTLDERSGTFSDAAVEKESADSNKILEIFTLTLGAEEDRAPWHYDYSLGYSQAGEESGDSEVVGLFVNEGVDIGYDAGGDFEQPRFFGTGAGATNAAGYELDEVVDEVVFNETRELALEFNARRDTTFGSVPGYLKFGFKSRLREAENDLDATIYDDFGGTFTVADFADNNVNYPPRSNFGPGVDEDSFRDFYNDNRGNFTVNAEDTAIDSRAEDYDIEEDIHAVYGMANAEFSRLQVLGGVRVEHTDYEATGTQVSVNEQTGSGNPVLTDFDGSNSYTDIFPGLHLRYQLSDRMQLRGALTRTIARPGFEAASPRQNIEVTDEGGGNFERVAEVGNPELDPLESDNLDVRWEFYPDGISVVSAGAFYKRIDNFFVVADTSGQPPFGNFDEVTQTINGDTADLFGVELEYVQQLAFLPSPWDGLLFLTNYTYTDSEAGLPQRDGDIPLPGQSDHIGNLALGYDKYGLSVRVAATYRSEFFEETNDPSDPAFDRYQDEHLQVDITSKYRINDTYQVYLNAININDEPLYAYFGDPRFNSQYEEYGSTYEAGLQVDFY